jgi:glycosyltransferase involved in cell wall biosynthesis
MVNSPGYINHVTDRGARKVELVPNGVDPAMFSPQATGEAVRKKFNICNKFIVLYAGAFGLSNDLGVVLQAADRLKDNPEIAFMLVGDGKEKTNLEKQAKELQLNNLFFSPAVPKSDMIDVLAASNLCIAILKPLELYKTTYPNKVFDYMAAARPVLLAIDGVIRQVVEDADAGIAVQPGEPQAMAAAIQSLFLSSEKTRQMGLSGRSYVENKFNRNDTAVQLENIMIKLRRSHG